MDNEDKGGGTRLVLTYTNYLHGFDGLGGDRRCGFTGTVFGPGFFGVGFGHSLMRLTSLLRRGHRIEEL